MVDLAEIQAAYYMVAATGVLVAAHAPRTIQSIILSILYDKST